MLAGSDLEGLSMVAPLQNIKVLDLSRVLAGPWASQVLADYGADVIKVEKPQGGDDTRAWGPPYLKDQSNKETTESAYYLSANRGKKSIAIDLSKKAGQAIVTALAKQSDILIENFKVGGLKRYSLDYDSLSAVNPRLIYCSITGFGQTGPYAHRAGYDAMIQGMGGLMSITGTPDGEPGEGPMKTGVAVADLMTGMYAVSAILAALHHRQQRGEGQHIDLALLDTQVAWLANQNMNYLVTGENPQRQGNSHPNIVPYQVVPTADGHIILAVGNDDQFRRFCAIAERNDLAESTAYATNAARVEHRADLLKIITNETLCHGSEWWLSQLEKAGVPCGPINSIGEAIDHPQIKHRNMLLKVPHPTAGEVSLINTPVKYSKTPVVVPVAPPLLGQHTDQILRDELGFDEKKVAQLKRDGTVG